MDGWRPSRTGKEGSHRNLQDDRGTSPHEEDSHRDGPETPDRQRQRVLGGASQGGRSSASVIDTTIEIAQGTADQEWLEQCHFNVPTNLRAKMMDTTPQQMGLYFDWSVAGEGALSSCHQVLPSPKTSPAWKRRTCG